MMMCDSKTLGPTFGVGGWKLQGMTLDVVGQNRRGEERG
jgi:hypothetical protein